MKRIGLLLPSSNTTQEQEFSKILPDLLSFHAARLTLKNVDVNSTIHILDELDRGVQSLCDADVDIILLALTAPSSRFGLGYDLELKRRIEAIAGKPAVTASTALIDALQVLNCHSLAFCAPWTADVNEFAVSFLTQNGFNTPAVNILGISSNLDIGRLPSSTAYEMAVGIDSSDTEAIMLACGNWACMEVIDDIEAKLKKPILTTNQVSLWGALKTLGGIPTLDGYGVLLKEHLT